MGAGGLVATGPPVVTRGGFRDGSCHGPGRSSVRLAGCVPGVAPPRSRPSHSGGCAPRVAVVALADDGDVPPEQLRSSTLRKCSPGPVPQVAHMVEGGFCWAGLPQVERVLG